MERQAPRERSPGRSSHDPVHSADADPHWVFESADPPVMTAFSTLYSPQERDQPETSPPASPPTGSCLRAFFAKNVVQRCISAAILAPAVTIFLWLSPAFATATVCSFMASACSYEFSWLAHRIHWRLFSRLTKLETRRGCAAAVTMASPSNRDVSATSSHSTHSNGISSSHGNNTGICQRPPLDSRSEIETPTPMLQSVVTAELSPRRRDAARAIEEDHKEFQAYISGCAVTRLAERCCCGSEWLAALLTSTMISAIMSTVFLTLASSLPGLVDTEFYEYRWFYVLSSNFVAVLSASFTPNWCYAVVCLFETVVFTLLTMQSTICSINEFSCGMQIDTSQIFLTGMLFILGFRFLAHKNGLRALMHFVLDALGFLYVVGTLSVLVSFVDDDKRTLYRKLLIALLYVVWASDTGAYFTGKLLAYLKYPYYHPLAAHLSKNKDYEGTLGAIGFGICAMMIASDCLDVPGSVLQKILFTVVAVIVGRIGDLFESLLKRAAGLKDSGRLIPGHGGMLDRIDALMFATLIFARYYALAVADE